MSEASTTTANTAATTAIDPGLRLAMDRRWRQVLPAVLAGLLWMFVVANGVQHHEFWRDEGRALSLALTSDSVWQLPAAIHGEGHPLLWYLLLRLAHELWASTAVLPLVSLLCGGLGVAVFAWRAPFPVWWKLLFMFGALPVYEYVVMARNYGISMLLMFAFAALLCRRRFSAVALGGLLFLLAQTNVHSALLVPLLALVWLDRWHSARSSSRPHSGSGLVLGFALAGAGLLCTGLSVHPARHTLLTSNLAMTAYAGGDYLRGFGLALLEPGHFFRRITFLSAVPGTIVLMAAVTGLVRRPLLLAVALLGLWMHAALFALVYAGEARHQGVWFMFLITLYWIALGTGGERAQASPWQDRLFRASFYLVVPAILVAQCGSAFSRLSLDRERELSKSAALARAVAADASLAGAVIVAQPDEFLEAVPYYLANPTFLLRERRPGNTATWSLALPRAMTLGDDLEQIRQLRASSGRPVLLILSHRWPAGSGDSTHPEDFGRQFTASAPAKRALEQSSTRMPLGDDAVRENFDVYVFR